VVEAERATTCQEICMMLTVDCPLCDTPAPYDTDADTLDCPACAIRLDIAADAPVAELAAAA
jgi:hypothetical protein